MGRQFDQVNNFAYTGVKGDLHVTVLENNYRNPYAPGTYEISLIYLTRRKGELSTYTEYTTAWLFPQAVWEQVFEEAGLSVETRPLEGLYDVYLQAEGEYRLTVFLEKNGPFGRIPPPFPYIDRNCGGHDNCGMDSRTLQPAVDTVLRYFPDTEALYLFGSHEEEEERPGSDIDIAVLLPAHLAADANAVLTFDLQPELSDALDKPVDCVNLRRVSVVFRKEIIFTGQRFFTGNTYAAEEFEMLTLSYYQKLNDERKAILEELFRTKRSYAL